MGSNESHQVPEDILNEVKDSTSFTRGEIEYLYYRFQSLCQQRGRKKFLTKRDFGYRAISIHNVILGEMFGANPRIEFPDFARFLHNFRPLDNNATENDHKQARLKKLRIIFSMYDTDKDGNISKRDLLQTVYKLLSDYANIRVIVQIVNVMMEEMDRMKVNRITFEDFCVAFEPFNMDLIAIKFPSL